MNLFVETQSLISNGMVITKTYIKTNKTTSQFIWLVNNNCGNKLQVQDQHITIINILIPGMVLNLICLNRENL